MNNWQALVFDLDDTLYPERDYIFSGFRAAATWAEGRLGIPAGQGLAELSLLFNGGARGNTFNLWLLQHGQVDEALVHDLVRVYRDHRPTLKPFPEAPGILAWLRQRYHLGLVSDGYLPVQQHKWAALGLAAYFDAVVFSDVWGRAAWKPCHQPFLAVLQQLQVAAARAVYIGDNPAKDFLGARELGMFTIRVRRPGGEYAQIDPTTSQHASHLTVGSLSELMPLFHC